MRPHLFAFAGIFASFTALAGCAAETTTADLEEETGEKGVDVVQLTYL